MRCDPLITWLAHAGKHGSVPDWFEAMEGAAMLGVTLWQWVGIPAPDEVPLCVKAWTFARATCKHWGAKFRAEIEKDGQDE